MARTEKLAMRLNRYSYNRVDELLKGYSMFAHFEGEVVTAQESLPLVLGCKDPLIEHGDSHFILSGQASEREA